MSEASINVSPDVGHCDRHPDRRGTWLKSNGELLCDECGEPWAKLHQRHAAERSELKRRQRYEREALERALDGRR